METVSNLTGQPIEVTLAGKKHKFRQLTLAELFGKFEAVVTNEHKDRVYEMAKGLTGEDKVAYLSYEAAHPILAERVVNLAREKMTSGAGVALILEVSHIPEGKEDVLPNVLSLVTDKAERVVLEGLVEELTGTAGIKLPEGSSSPKL